MHRRSVIPGISVAFLCLALGAAMTVPAAVASTGSGTQVSSNVDARASGPARLGGQRRIGPRTVAKHEPAAPPRLRVGPACSPVVATLSNGAYGKDGSLNITVDGLGAFGSRMTYGSYAYYNPIGGIGAASTVYRSWLYLSAVGTFLEDACSSVVSASSNRLVTMSDLGPLRLRVTQSVGAIGARGSTLTQTYQITNSSGGPLDLALARYVDGDLYLLGDLSDDGGAASSNGSVLYEFEWSDSHSAPSTYLGMSGSLDGDRTPDRWAIQHCCPWDGIITAGHIPAPVDGVVEGDSDADRMVDAPYDVTMSQEWDKHLATGASMTFTATTRYGRAEFDQPPPTAAFDATWKAGTRTVVFDAGSSANATSWRWDFGDGTPAVSGERVVHAYAKSREYTVTLTVGGGGGQTAIDSAPVAVDPVHIYAPNVHLHPAEPVQPWSADEFIKAASLVWAADGGCDDPVKAGTGRVDAGKLGSGGYTARRLDDLCHPTGRYYTTAERTAPWHNGGVLPADEIEEGFTLDIPPSARGGDAAAAHVYWVYKEGVGVAYWFFFPYNDWNDQHEGDWEHVVVKLDRHSAIQSVRYYRHACDPKILTTDQIDAQQDGSSFAGSSHHPDVWVAKGSHGMYWKSGSYSEVSDCMIGTDEMADGNTWPIWTGDVLERLSTKPWRAYQGAWGGIGQTVYASGPLGPH